MKEIRTKLGAILLVILVVSVGFGTMVCASEGGNKENRVVNADEMLPTEIKEMIAKGMSEDEIAKTLLAKYSVKEKQSFDDRTPGWIERTRIIENTYPFADVVSVTDTGITGLIQKDGRMHTLDIIYQGINSNMKSGPIPVEYGGTLRNVVTSHVGAGGYWVEVGIVNDVDGPHYKVYTVDNDEGGWDDRYEIYVDPYTSYNFGIKVFNSQDAQGWIYVVWFNNRILRSQHLPCYYNDVDEVREAWSSSGTFTTDLYGSFFTNPFLYKSGSEVWWGTNILDEFYGLYPMRVLRWIPSGQSAYTFKSWMQY
jgi:hypothetical protein